MILHGFLFIVSALLLWFGAGWIVDSAAAVARRFKISELVIGLTVVAAGTSAPEFLVTAMAAFKGVHDISLSNVVGSNIFNLGFILGTMALLKPLPTTRAIVYRDGMLLWATTMAIAGMASFGTLPRWFGLALLALLACYVLYLATRGNRAEIFIEEVEQREATRWDYPKLAAGFGAIALGGHLMVEAASAIALDLGVSRWAIGVTIVAAGTSLPEMVTCLAAVLRSKHQMMLGNLVGSDFFNFAGVLGLTCLLKPLTVSPEALPSLGVLVAMIGLVLFFMRSFWTVTRLEGAILILITMLRWVRDFSTVGG